jgi:hypothetical protein
MTGRPRGSRPRVIDIAGLFGGIAGFHHPAVRVRRTVDG